MSSVGSDGRKKSRFNERLSVSFERSNPKPAAKNTPNLGITQAFPHPPSHTPLRSRLIATRTFARNSTVANGSRKR